MKALSNLIIAMLVCTTTFAKQALWGGQDIKSLEIHTNNTVTFRLMAPEATKVEITGDFLPTQKMQTPYGEYDAPGVAALTKNAQGVWEFTTPEPLAPELYSYTLIVDGVKIIDPGNVYMIRDVASVTSVFIIGGGRADLYKVNNVPHGTVARRWYDSPILNMTRRITIYTPSGYETSTAKYPVFYLLHGAGGDEEAWMDGEFETAFPDVMKFIESNYRTIENKTNRAIAGLSMGGFIPCISRKDIPTSLIM